MTVDQLDDQLAQALVAALKDLRVATAATVKMSMSGMEGA